MEESRSLAPVLLVVGLAFIVPLVLSRFRHLQVPVVVGEILAGMVIGKSGFDLVPEDPILSVLSALGFAFLMFLSGLEIDFSMLAATNRDSRGPSGNPAIAGLLIFGLTVASATLIALGVTTMGLVRSPWLLGLILSTTSLGIVLPVLRERGLSGGVYGQTILLAALIADFATMVLITVVVAIMSGGLTLEVLLVGLLLLAFLFASRFARVFSRWRPLRNALDELASATVQIKVRGALAVMFAFVVLSEVLGAEIILGAFLAGALIALVSSPEDSGDLEAQHKLDAIGFGFLVPVFFIMVGVNFDLPALLSSATALILFPVLLAAAYAVKVLPSLVLSPQHGRRQALAAGVLLSSRLSLIIAASAIGMRLGLISEALNADIVLVAVVTSTISPALFNRMLPKQALAATRPIVVVGAGQTGMLVAQRLSTHNEPIIVVDEDAARLERAKRMGYETHQVDPTRAEGLIEAGIENARSLAVTTGDDSLNLQVCRLARSTFGVSHIICYVQDATLIRQFQQLGVHVVNPGLASASVIDGLLRFPDAYQLLTSLEDDKDVVEIEVNNPECAGRRLRDMRLPGDVLVLALRRDGRLVVPHGQNQIDLGDHVTLLGSEDAVAEAAAILRG